MKKRAANHMLPRTGREQTALTGWGEIYSSAVLYSMHGRPPVP